MIIAFNILSIICVLAAGLLFVRLLLSLMTTMQPTRVDLLSLITVVATGIPAVILQKMMS
jgi:hypothetical protein